MRLIHCKQCAARAAFRSLPAGEDGPGETVRRVDGHAALGLRCDGCNVEVRVGDPVTAWSVWPAGRALACWERGYLL